MSRILSCSLALQRRRLRASAYGASLPTIQRNNNNLYHDTALNVVANNLWQQQQQRETRRSMALYAVGEGWTGALTSKYVLEHIPGHYKDHLERFIRMLQPGGVMVFSVPGPYLDQETTEGGEHLNTDRERLEKFKQEDHFKLFGRDFVKYLAEMENCELISDGITDEFRQSVSVRKGKATFYILRKDQDKGQ